MASKALKGLTIQIGADTSELNDALRDVDKQSSSLSKELGQINRLLKFDPTDTNLLAQKQKVLADSITNTEKKLSTLREAERQAQEQFERGEIAEEQYRALQREVIATEQKLGKLKSAAKETAEAVDKLGEETENAKKGIKETGEAAEDAEDAIEELDGRLADAARNGFTALAAAATAAVGAIVATAEASREYRTEMGKLNTAYETSGYSADVARAAYEELQSVIGETDQSVEAAQQIALLANSAEDVAKWADLAGGVVGRFGDALQPETFYEAANEVSKLGESTAAWTQMLEQSGVMTVEEFNEGLADCNTEAAKQAYMLKVAEKALGSASKEYKKTNAEIIRANAAAENWNRAVADIGEEMEPVVTDIKEMGTALLKEAKEPMKQAADFVRTKLLPALTKLSKWSLNNLPEIGQLIAGVAATIVLYKAAALSAETATKGLSVATILQQKAQRSLNLVMNANPYVLAATAIVALTTAVVAFRLAAEEARKAADPLTEAERELMAAADEAAEAFREQQKATEEAFSTISSEMRYVENLADELHGLADASGRVQEKDQTRAQFILGELNEALGTEYTMVGGIIQQYSDLEASIQDVITAKTANALLEAANESYIAAIQNEGEAWNNTKLKLKDYEEQQRIVDTYRAMSEQNWAKYYEALQNGNQQAASSYRQLALGADINLKKEQEVLDEKKSAYDSAQATYDSYQETILNYQTAQEKALNGEYQTAIDIFSRKGELYTEHSETVGVETAKVLAALKKEAEDALIKAELTKENFEKGVAGFTEEMVDEAAQGYREAMDAYETAYADAYAVGEDFGQGVADGITVKNGNVAASAIAQIRAAVNAAKKEAEINSPSKKTMAIGEGLGEGAEVGLDNTTPDVKKAAGRQVDAMLEPYRAQEVTGQNALRHMAEQQAARYTASQMSMASANSPTLEKILTAIEKGQVLMLDGEALVGATASRMDNALGRRRDLAAKGAI